MLVIRSIRHESENCAAHLIICIILIGLREGLS